MGKVIEMDIIETLLCDQLKHALEETKKSSNPLLKTANLNEDLSEIITYLNKYAPTSRAEADEMIRKEKLYYVNNVMAEWQMILKTHRCPTAETSVAICKLRKSITQIRKDVEARKTKPESVKDTKPESVKDGIQYLEAYRPWSSRSVDPAKIFGIEDKAMIMERLLFRKEIKNDKNGLWIVGTAGVGKTTLCQTAFNNEQVKKHFVPRIWVCLSKQPKKDYTAKEAAKRILTCLGFKENIIEKVGQVDGDIRGSLLILALQQQLRGKRYLIVLDDVWDFFSMKQQTDNYDEDVACKIDPHNFYSLLEFGLPKGHGEKVVVTCRYEEMAKKIVGKKSLHRLLPLADKESCFKIFEDAVEKSESLAAKDHEIRSSCNGLPLLAKMMGQIVQLQNHKTAPLV